MGKVNINFGTTIFTKSNFLGVFEEKILKLNIIYNFYFVHINDFRKVKKKVNTS